MVKIGTNFSVPESNGLFFFKKLFPLKIKLVLKFGFLSVHGNCLLIVMLKRGSILLWSRLCLCQGMEMYVNCI